MTGLLLVVAAGRIIPLRELPMNADEIWSIWQTFGTPADVLRWTPQDWPFPYFLTVWGWKELVGITPLALRMSSVLVSLLGAAGLYAVTRRIWDEKTALFALVIYGGLGFSIFLGVLLRAYAILLGLTPLVLFLAWHYLERPTLIRAVWLALGAVAIFFVHFTGLFALGAIGVWLAVCYPRRLWRLWLPGLIAAPLPIAHVAANWQFFFTRTGTNAMKQLPPLPQALAEAFAQFSGAGYPVWVILFVAASALMILRWLRWPSERRRMLASLAWIGLIAPMYWLHDRFGLFQDLRYIWWILPGLILWMGAGLAMLSWRLWIAVLAGVALLTFFPGVVDRYQREQFHSEITLDTYLVELKQYLLPGDVLVVDPNNICGPVETWDYFHRVYFPTGLPYVREPGDYRRVWYVSTDWLRDPPTYEAILAGRVAGKYFGPPACLFRLYEAPPDREGMRYDNGLRFHGAEILRPLTSSGAIYHEGETIRVRLWWSVDQPLGLDYSVNLRTVTPAGIAENNGPPRPLDGPPETSRWEAGRYYIEERELQLPPALQGGRYSLQLVVYQWWDAVPLITSDTDENGLLTLDTYLVHSW